MQESKRANVGAQPLQLRRQQGSATTALTITSASSTLLKASVPASLIANPGKASVSVVNPGGKVSNSKPFTILLTSLKLLSAKVSKTGAGTYNVSLTLKNVGYQSASSLKITKSSLGAATTSTTLPVSLGNLGAGTTKSTTLGYPGTAGSSGTVVVLKVAATFTGGSFNASLKVTLP